MSHVEWATVAQDLLTPVGTIFFNSDAMVVGTSSGFGRYQLIDEACGMSTVPRSTRMTDDVPQGDGYIQHRRFETGIELQLGIQLFLNEGTPACDGDLRCMLDLLSLNVRSLLNADGPYRFRWSPTGYGDRRMLDQLRLRKWAPPKKVRGGVWQVDCTFDSPFPYGIDMTQQLFTITDGDSEVITNVGTTSFYPVFKIYGPASFVTIQNVTQGVDLVYDDGFPGALPIGGGDYIEIDTFRNTVYLNGNVAGRKAGIDILASDFFNLQVGPNEIGVSGADIDVLYNNPWW